MILLSVVRLVSDESRQVVAVCRVCSGESRVPDDCERLYARQCRYGYDEPLTKYFAVECGCADSDTVLSRRDDNPL